MGWLSKPKKPGPTEQERELAAQGARQWNRFEEKFSPAADRLLDLTKANDSGRRAFTRGAEGEAGTAFGGAGQAGQLALGGAYGSGTVRALGDLSGARATAVGGAAAEGEQALRARDLRTRMRVAALDRGISDQGSVAMGAAGQRATGAALAKGQRSIDLMQGITSGVATGIGVYTGVKGARTPTDTG